MAFINNMTDSFIESTQKEILKKDPRIPSYARAVVLFVYRSPDPKKNLEFIIKASLLNNRNLNENSIKPNIFGSVESLQDPIGILNTEITVVPEGIEVFSEPAPGDEISVVLISNEETRNLNVDGYYQRTIKKAEGPSFTSFVGSVAEQGLNALMKTFSGAKNRLFGSPVRRGVTDVGKVIEQADSWVKGQIVGKINIVRVQGKRLEQNTAIAFLKMKEAAEKDGIYLNITSGFRSNQEQTYLYSLYKSGRGNKASVPGYSNHQNGKALDLSNPPENVAWLRRNASKFNFYETVSGEDWHWEYDASKATPSV